MNQSQKDIVISMVILLKDKKSLDAHQLSIQAMKAILILVRRIYCTQKRLVQPLSPMFFPRPRTVVLKQHHYYHHRPELQLTCQIAITVNNYHSVTLVPLSWKNFPHRRLGLQVLVTRISLWYVSRNSQSIAYFIDIYLNSCWQNYQKDPCESTNSVVWRWRWCSAVLKNCEVCGVGDHEDRMLLCDCWCDGYNMECLDPPLEVVPLGEWFYLDCIRFN